MQFVNGVFNNNRAIIFFETDNTKPLPIKVKLGEVYFQWNEFSPLEQEFLLKEIDRNNGDVI